MKSFCAVGLATAVVLSAMAAFAATPAANPQADKNMKAFPPAADGQTRFVLQLPQADNENSMKVEIIVGKTVQTDAVNSYFFGGKIEAQNVEGWGFTKYVVAQLGPMAGTLMAPPPGAGKVDRFVALGGEPYLVRYNSKLPLVIYVPQGVEVRYKIWSAPAKATAVEAG
jgi:ecotin